MRLVTHLIKTHLSCKMWSVDDAGTPMDRMQTPVERTSFDDALDALAHRERRRLLRALVEHNPQDARPISADDADGTALEQLLAMRHVHLPKLQEYGFVEWDKDADEVSTGPNFAEIRPLLELLDDHADELPPGWQ